MYILPKLATKFTQMVKMYQNSTTNGGKIKIKVEISQNGQKLSKIVAVPLKFAADSVHAFSHVCD